MYQNLKFFIGRKIRLAIFFSRLPYSYLVDYILQFLKFSQWIKKKKNQFIKTFKKREDLYIFLNDKFFKKKKITYLEFGVAEGNSFKFWIKLNKNKKSVFYGFDTFIGLPERYNNPLYNLPKGQFSQRGKIPNLDDDRCKFYKGLIHNTLPIFLKNFKSIENLVVNIDVDLYSPTLFILIHLRKFIPKNNIFIFDEFATGIHEFRAFIDFVEAYKIKYRLISSSDDCYSRVALKFII
jgi:O-methyltransferase